MSEMWRPDPVKDVCTNPPEKPADQQMIDHVDAWLQAMPFIKDGKLHDEIKLGRDVFEGTLFEWEKDHLKPIRQEGIIDDS